MPSRSELRHAAASGLPTDDSPGCDPPLRGGERVFHKLVPGCSGQKHVTLKGGGHFLQEDVGEALGNAIVDFVSQYEGKSAGAGGASAGAGAGAGAGAPRSRL